MENMLYEWDENKNGWNMEMDFMCDRHRFILCNACAMYAYIGVIVYITIYLFSLCFAIHVVKYEIIFIKFPCQVSIILVHLIFYLPKDFIISSIHTNSTPTQIILVRKGNFISSNQNNCQRALWAWNGHEMFN